MFDFSFLFDGLVLTNQTIFDKMPCVLVLVRGPFRQNDLALPRDGNSSENFIPEKNLKTY